VHDDALDLGIVDLARDARPRLVEQPLEATLDKAPAPLANRLHAHPLACRHRFVAQQRSPAQHDPRPQRQSLGRLAPLRTASQDAGNITRQFELGDRTTRSHLPLTPM
jgi:hypothetical protein